MGAGTWGTSVVILKSGFGGAGLISLSTVSDREVPLIGGLVLPLWLIETAVLVVLVGVLMVLEIARRARAARACVSISEAAAERVPALDTA
jgi:hypothetical protein